MFFCRVGSHPYPKVGLFLLLYQDKIPWILILPPYCLLFCLFALRFSSHIDPSCIGPSGHRFCSFCHPICRALTPK